MLSDRKSDIADVLERIRARLKVQVETGLTNEAGASKPAGSTFESLGSLQALLASVQMAHRQVGVLNPRNPGFINSLMQNIKKFVRRVLTWYTRSIVEFQTATIRFLTETAEILTRHQSRIDTLEKKTQMLAAELAEMRQHDQSRLDLVIPDPGKAGAEEK